VSNRPISTCRPRLAEVPAVDIGLLSARGCSVISVIYRYPPTRISKQESSAVADMPPERLYERIRQRPPVTTMGLLS